MNKSQSKKEKQNNFNKGYQKSNIAPIINCYDLRDICIVDINVDLKNKPLANSLIKDME